MIGRSRGNRPATGRLGGPTQRLGSDALAIEFGVLSVLVLSLVHVGEDARIYQTATNAWLTGGDPWGAGADGALFAGPPLTLLTLWPIAWLPPAAMAAVMIGLDLAAAVWLVRRLKLPPWWILFPPLVEGIALGNPDVLVIALLVGSGSVIAALFKVYAVLPMAILGRWRGLVGVALVTAATLPILPWDHFFSHDVLHTLSTQSGGGRSATVAPWLIPIVIAAFFLVGRQRAAWFAVPALWPSSQYHYAVLSVPALTLPVAAVMALPLPGAPAAAVLVAALLEIREHGLGRPMATFRATRERIRHLGGSVPATSPASRAVPASPDDQPAHVSIVIPVYNEGEAVAAVVRAMSAAVRTAHEIVIVYDFDGDTTVPVIARLAADYSDVRGLRNDLGRGVLNAMRAGIAETTSGLVVISMADGSDEPERIDEMVALAGDGADLVAASRYMRGGRQVGGPLLKRLMSRTAGLTLHWFAGVPIHDPTNNFKLYRRSFLESVKIESTAGFELALELTVKATVAKRRLAEVPTTWRDRTSGTSNFKLRKWLPHYLRWYFAAFRAHVRSGF